MTGTIVFLLIMVFIEPGATRPTVTITVEPDRATCERSKAAIEKGAAVQLQLCQCAPFDLGKAERIAKGQR